MKKLNCKYAIGTYEMDLLSKEDFSYVIDKLSTVCKYIDTAINYNNDYLFSDIQNKTIISKIAPCQTDYFDFLLTKSIISSPSFRLIFIQNCDDTFSVSTK